MGCSETMSQLSPHNYEWTEWNTHKKYTKEAPKGIEVVARYKRCTDCGVLKDEETRPKTKKGYDFLETVEETFQIDLDESDVLVWNFQRVTSQEVAGEMKDKIKEVMPETEHLLFGEIENLYKINQRGKE